MDVLQILASVLSWKWLRYVICFYIIQFLTLIYSVVVFLLIYHTYVPTVSLERNLDLVFDTNCSGTSLFPNEICSFPTVEFSLSDHGFPLLTSGFPYTLLLNLQIPDSPSNRQTGMSILVLDLLDQNKSLIKTFRKPFSVPYRSDLVRLIASLFYAPLYIFGNIKEEQKMTVIMSPDFESQVDQPVMKGRVTLESRRLIWSSIELGIYARLTGIRSWLYHYPQLSLIGCVTFLTIFMNSIYATFLLSYLIWTLSLLPRQSIGKVQSISRQPSQVRAESIKKEESNVYVIEELPVKVSPESETTEEKLE